MADDSEILKQLDSVLDDSMTQAQRFLAMWRVAQTSMPIPDTMLVAPALITIMQSNDPGSPGQDSGLAGRGAGHRGRDSKARGSIVMTIRPVRELAKDEVVEGEVLVDTKIITGQGSVLRYCTVANCTVEGAGRAEHCLMVDRGDLDRRRALGHGRDVRRCRPPCHADCIRRRWMTNASRTATSSDASGG